MSQLNPAASTGQRGTLDPCETSTDSRPVSRRQLREVIILTRFTLLRTVGRMTREEIEKRMDELAREYVETHNPEIAVELYRLARELEKMEEGVIGIKPQALRRGQAQ
jgi:hypothetical protein